MATTITGTTIDVGPNKLVANSAGNVGIGTASPAKPLDVTGDIRTSTGILFGTDTAAANTLDDYEEGTFNVSCGGQTTQNGLGRYVKVGQMCTVTFIFVANASPSNTGTALNLGGFPFVAGSGCNTVVNLMLWSGTTHAGSATGAFANGIYIAGDLDGGNASFYVRSNSTGSNPYQRQELLQSGSALRVSCTYRTA